MISEQSAATIAHQLFGVSGEIKRLPGEYDHNFHLRTADAELLLKISREPAARDIIEMQNDVMQHLQFCRVPFQSPVSQQGVSGADICEYGTGYLVRLFDYVPGKLFAQSEQTPSLLASLGRQLGFLGKALADYRHSAAKRKLKWDLLQAEWIQEHITVLAAADRECVNYFLQHFLKSLPVLAQLRRSVIHGDLNDYNILVSTNPDGEEFVSGLIDFGDVVESATICELAIATAYAMMHKPDPLAAAVVVIHAYHAVFPLQTNEIDLLFDLICMRLCVSVVNSALRKEENPGDAYLTISEQPAWQLLRQLRAIDRNFAITTLRQACSTQTADILKMRQRLIGKNVGLSYRQPLHIVRGAGQYLYDESGREYLDCVNNVCHVGHCHPSVVSAAHAQMSVLNTNTRYLHEALVQYAEKLAATLPAPLEVCFFVCSGSEANELAIRLARTYTQRHDIVVMDHGYYGNTSTLINISPYKFNGKGGAGKADFVHVIPQPDSLRNTGMNIPEITSQPAAFICEALPGCGGQVVLPENYLQQVYAAIRAAGGVCIADEVQTGLGRVGSHFWAFETQAVIPDIVTLGKPLGNGHPVGAVITTRAIADAFCNGMEYFNTFGGNPVSCAVGMAVLDVIKNENLQAHAHNTGEYLKQKLQNLQKKYAVIADVRGYGLFLGVELTQDAKTLAPAGALAVDVVNAMKGRGILLSVDGCYQNVIKIKPPMVITKQDCDKLVDVLDNVLSAV